MTPVALITGRNENSIALRSWWSTAPYKPVAAVSIIAGEESLPAVISSRSRASTVLTASATAGCPSRAISGATSARCSNSWSEGPLLSSILFLSETRELCFISLSTLRDVTQSQQNPTPLPPAHTFSASAASGAALFSRDLPALRPGPLLRQCAGLQL